MCPHPNRLLKDSGKQLKAASVKLHISRGSMESGSVKHMQYTKERKFVLVYEGIYIHHIAHALAFLDWIQNNHRTKRKIRSLYMHVLPII